jgi:mannose-1-phosphate guanylyltransferase
LAIISQHIIKIKGLNMTNVILCGGTGTRLWPISRENYPKQFLQIFENEDLIKFQENIL